MWNGLFSAAGSIITSRNPLFSPPTLVSFLLPVSSSPLPFPCPNVRSHTNHPIDLFFFLHHFYIYFFLPLVICNPIQSTSKGCILPSDSLTAVLTDPRPRIVSPRADPDIHFPYSVPQPVFPFSLLLFLPSSLILANLLLFFPFLC